MPLAWHCGHFFFYDGYEEKVEEYTAILENVIDLDSIAGTYCGVPPPNVETTLTLNEDGTYCLKQESTNDSDSSEVLNGIFKVLDGSILMLEHLSSGYNIFYRVSSSVFQFLVSKTM